MNRREILTSMAGGALALGAGCAATVARSSPSATRIRWAQGWLLWRDVPGQSLRQAILDLHAVGADGIEYSPRKDEPEKHGFSRESLLAFLAERGMSISAQYFPTPGGDAGRDKILSEARARVAMVKAFGARNMVVQAPRRPENRDPREAIMELAPILNEIGRVALGEGVQAGIHPHLNTLVESSEETDLVLSETDPSLLFLSADTGHIHLAGGDVVTLLRKHSKRLNYFHFKDCVRPPGSTRPDFFPNLRELGGGEIDFPGVMGLLKEIGYTGWINVEQDRSHLAPGQAAAASMGYVKRTLKAIYT